MKKPMKANMHKRHTLNTYLDIHAHLYTHTHQNRSPTKLQQTAAAETIPQDEAATAENKATTNILWTRISMKQQQESDESNKKRQTKQLCIFLQSKLDKFETENVEVKALGERKQFTCTQIIHTYTNLYKHI